MPILFTALVLGMLAAPAQAQSAPAGVIAKPPVPINPGSWVMNQDYPKEAIKAREHGLTSFVLDVDRDGKVTGCTLTLSSGSALLDATTCSLLTRRARFVPARDARGKRVPATYRNRFNWMLPE